MALRPCHRALRCSWTHSGGKSRCTHLRVRLPPGRYLALTDARWTPALLGAVNMRQATFRISSQLHRQHPELDISPPRAPITTRPGPGGGGRTAQRRSTGLQLARQQKLDYQDFLELILADECPMGSSTYPHRRTPGWREPPACAGFRAHVLAGRSSSNETYQYRSERRR